MHLAPDPRILCYQTTFAYTGAENINFTSGLNLHFKSINLNY